MAADQGLRGILHAFLTPGSDIASYFRFHDAPPDAVNRALDAVDPSCRTSRPNGQPSAQWLVDMAKQLGGKLAGHVAVDDGLADRVRVDAMCVPGDQAADLARSVARDWPNPQFGEEVLDLALAEGWSSWDSPEPCWTGLGRDLLSAAPRAAVIGLWWD